MAEALRDVQARFLAGVIANDAAAEALIVDDNRVGAAKRLAIYRNNYRSSLTGVLADHYERLHAYVGDEQFDNLAEAYVDAHPSQTRNLRYYGERFPAFLGQHYPDDGELAELAALDWALRDAFDASDASTLTAVQIGSLGDAWIERRLMLHPSVRLLPVRYNVAKIWSAVDCGDEPPAPERLAEHVHLLVWRNGGLQQYRGLSDAEARMLALVGGGCSFTGLSGRIIEELGEEAATQRLAAWLVQWLAEGLLTLAD